jgi:hypothetical protein
MELIKTREDKNKAMQILKNSFSQSQGMNWMLKNKSSSRSKEAIIGLMYHESRLLKGNYLTSDGNGVVLFYQLRKNNFLFSQFLRKLSILIFHTGLRKGLQALRYQKIIHEIRPKTGWLGLLVATNQSVKGNAAAYEIKQAMFSIADEHNETIYVETTIPRVRALYRASGYEEYFSLPHPYFDLNIWFFRREPTNMKTL